jgi:hypothetical protein
MAVMCAKGCYAMQHLTYIHYSIDLICFDSIVPCSAGYCINLRTGVFEKTQKNTHTPLGALLSVDRFREGQ